MNPTNAVTRLLLDEIEEGYRAKSWHGTNLRGSIRGLSAREASWRPGKGRHNIWEIAVHAAYWKYIVRRRLLGERRGSFPIEGSNWFVRPAKKGAAGEAEWKGDVRLLEEMHRALLEAVAPLSERALGVTPPGSSVSHRKMLSGIAMHDVYHAGQIQIIKRMMRG